MNTITADQLVKGQIIKVDGSLEWVVTAYPHRRSGMIRVTTSDGVTSLYRADYEFESTGLKFTTAQGIK